MEPPYGSPSRVSFFLRRAHILHLMKNARSAYSSIRRSRCHTTPYLAKRQTPTCLLPVQAQRPFSRSLFSLVEYIFSTSTTKVSSISLAKVKETSSHDWLYLIVCTKPTRTTAVMSSDERHPRDVPYIRIELATTNEYHLPKATYETTCYHEVRHTVNSFFVALFFIRVLRQTNRQL